LKRRDIERAGRDLVEVATLVPRPSESGGLLHSNSLQCGARATGTGPLNCYLEQSVIEYPEGTAVKKLLLAAGTLALSFAAPAMATDLARRPAPVYAPPAPVVAYYTWTGCYVGGNGGGLWANKEWIDRNPLDPSFGASFGSHTASGGLGGVQAGCNYQVGSWVFGVQGDYDWAGITGSNANTVFTRFTDQTQIQSLASVTARTGYAWDRFLGYVKGGGAWEKDNYSLLIGGATVATASETRGGWTIGIGAEYAFLDWLTGFVEYDYYDFGTRTNALACAFAVCGLTSATVLFDVKETKNVFKAGLNFKFGPSTRY
jgi:outer membrane immunogenic protein